MKLENIINSIMSWKKRNIREGAITEAGALGGLISGSVALYLGLQEGFNENYNYLNTISTLYGVGAISAGINHFGGKAYRGFKGLIEVMKYVDRQKK